LKGLSFYLLLGGITGILKKRTAQWSFMPCRGALGGGLYGNWACAFTLQKKTQLLFYNDVSIKLTEAKVHRRNLPKKTMGQTFATDL
jgi:hypothetical protein